MTNILARLAAAIVLAAGAWTAALAEDYVVVDSSADAIKQGAALTSGAIVDVPAGARIVLLATSGKMQTIAGPFRGPIPGSGPAAPPSGRSQAFDAISGLFHNADQPGEPYVARGVDWRAHAVKTRDEALAVDATDGGETCLFGHAGAALIHDPAHPGAMAVQLISGPIASVTWAKGQVRQPWPADLPIVDGGLYVFAQTAPDTLSTAAMHLLPADAASNDLERIARMADAGCRDQALLLLAVIARSAK